MLIKYLHKSKHTFTYIECGIEDHTGDTKRGRGWDEEEKVALHFLARSACVLDEVKETRMGPKSVGKYFNGTFCFSMPERKLRVEAIISVAQRPNELQ